MVLIKCRECGNNISDNADHCPHCGYYDRQVASENEGPLVNLSIGIAVFGLLALVLVLLRFY